jgi:uncharacterized membrane protein
MRPWRFGVVVVTALFLAMSLLLSSRNITPAHAPLTPVRAPVELSTVPSFLLHWGFPLALISAAMIVLLPGARMKVVAILFFAASLLVQDAVVLIYLLLLFNTLRLLEVISTGDKPLTPFEWVMEVVVMAALGLLLFPELFFLDDPYGGKDERMNTVFKVYVLTWSLSHMGAFYLLSKAYHRTLAKVPPVLPTLVQLATLGVLTSYFRFLAFDLRPRDLPLPRTAEGLSKVNADYPGARQAIQQLRALPYGTVLEAQGDPYSYTAHVATLASMRSYLGWANHVELLTRNFDEVRRRIEATTQIYREAECETKRSLAAERGIDYIVLGPLERERMPWVEERSFGCMAAPIRAERYIIWHVRR